jgi:hypothetical protein
MKRTIEVIVSPSGEIQIDAVGFTGADCEKATRFLEEALGVVSNRMKKPEYHASTSTRHEQKLGA